MLEYMYPQAVEAGIPSTEYWGMTLEEIMIQVQANKKIKENELKERAMFDYSQQRLAVFAFNDPKKFPKFEEAYPFLKQIEQAVEEAKTEEESKQEAMKRDQEIFMAQAEAIKATRKRKNNQER
ncbi:hypothetical protein M4I17_09705 [Enterococcus thailandicus]|uniref:hypothetical protein n=1 Tax=Enterococcus thailandicus TaxID=417368 RepID=UPI0025431A8C|nr:hypothetical protein [Enterococcus thailandicus]MDK4352672.1 hypothetical protein [Enterococcus thailandicus]MDT2735414.1 hypothetical protein [Enterococcus thailandicus]